MDTIDAIIGLLNGEDGELQNAAALVLGRLRPVEPRVLNALRAALDRSEPASRPYIIDAMASTGLPEVLPDLLDQLQIRGSLSEQAVHLVRGFGTQALPALKAALEGEAGWPSGAWLKAVTGIGHLDAIRLVVERLPHTDWNDARATSIFLLENLDIYPEDALQYLREQITRMLDDGDAGQNPNALITALRLIKPLGLTISTERVLHFTSADYPPPVRRHALLVFDREKPSPAELGLVRDALLELLFERDEVNVVTPALELLGNWCDQPMSQAELERLTTSSWFSVVEFACFELARHYGAPAIPAIAVYLESGTPRLRILAAEALMHIPEAADLLLDAMTGPMAPPWRQDFAERMAAGRKEWPGRRLVAMRREYLAMARREGRYDRPVLEFLTRHDRRSFSNWLARRCWAMLRADRADEVIAVLQPIVRWRHATEDVRMLLALANLEATSHLVPSDARFARGVELLASLLRVPHFDLATRLAEDWTFAPERAEALRAALRSRGPRDADLADSVRSEPLPDQ
ncbi:MAG: hypothetical protein KDB53_21700 [Planctomycetes bacterium]|nr:hypothetical protein [Planctomycetota bacterium]